MIFQVRPTLEELIINRPAPISLAAVDSNGKGKGRGRRQKQRDRHGQPDDRKLGREEPLTERGVGAARRGSVGQAQSKQTPPQRRKSPQAQDWGRKEDEEYETVVPR